MTELENLKLIIEKAKQDYYQTGTSSLSDAEYDALVAKAEKLGYIESVGSHPVPWINEIEHEHPMLSLAKCHSVYEVQSFAGDRDVVFMWKADGLSASVTYIDGVLTRLETRGNGMKGNDVLFHANSIRNLPKVINKSGRYVIDGECVILQQDFNLINTSGEYSNPRNLASGSLNQLDPAISVRRHLCFYAWDIIEGGCDSNLLDNLIEAQQLGFETTEYKLVKLGAEEADIESILNQFKQSAINYGMPADGVVIKFNDITYGKSLGRTDKFFRNAIAYKFANELYETRLQRVEWQSSKTLAINPIAVFDPVDIDGAEVAKATLHNLAYIRALGLTNHCTCYVCRANEVIPRVEECEDDGDGAIEIPETCPTCGSKTKVVGDVLYCTNPNCKGALLGKLVHFVSRKAMNIDGLSEKTLSILINANKLKSFTDIYHYENWVDYLKSVPGFGKRSIDKLIAAIDKSRDCKLENFICALSIAGIGSAQSKVLATYYKDWESFYKAATSGQNFSIIEGFGDAANKNIRNYFRDNKDIDTLVSCVHLSSAIPAASSMESSGKSNRLAGKLFVITGKLHGGTRDQYIERITALGGKVSGAVSKNTSYLINNDINSSSSKNVKAKSLGVPIISEADFLEMIK